MPAAVAATITAPEVIIPRQNQQALVEIKIPGLERKQAGWDAGLLAPAVVAPIGADVRLAVFSSAAPRTVLSGNVHGNCACTR